MNTRKYAIFGLVLIGFLALAWTLNSYLFPNSYKLFSFSKKGNRTVASPENAIPFCKSDNNIVGSSLIGTWIEEAELNRRLTNPSTGEQVILHEAVFTEDDSVAQLFDSLKEMGKCAYLAGHMTVVAAQGGHKVIFESPFVLSESIGNPTLFIDKKWANNNQISDLQPIFVMVAKSTDSSRDILFVGDKNNNKDMHVLIRK